MTQKKTRYGRKLKRQRTADIVMNDYVYDICRMLKSRDKKGRKLANGILKYIVEEVLSGNTIHIPNFGSFDVVGNRSYLTNSEPSPSQINWKQTKKLWEEKPLFFNKIWVLLDSSDNYHYKFRFSPRGTVYFKFYTFTPNMGLKKVLQNNILSGKYYYAKVKSHK